VTQLPVLYSFRRCPYAIRARLALAYAGIGVEHREVVLRNKPQHMLEISSKGTVPVLLLPDGKVIDESLEIMFWALQQQDTDYWLDAKIQLDMDVLVQSNDAEFKYYLDRYKYADRYPQFPQVFYRQKAELFLQELENRLRHSQFLCGEQILFADAAVFPFIRQFAAVDKQWFGASRYQALNTWLQQWLASELFVSVMKKYQPWTP
jgi:glutathione S-transferase